MLKHEINSMENKTVTVTVKTELTIPNTHSTSSTTKINEIKYEKDFEDMYKIHYEKDFEKQFAENYPTYFNNEFNEKIKGHNFSKEQIEKMRDKYRIELMPELKEKFRLGYRASVHQLYHSLHKQNLGSLSKNR